MQVDVLITLGVVTTVIGLLAFSRIAPDVVLLGGLTLLMVIPIHVDGAWRLGVLSAPEALSGLSNPGLVTVGVLFIVVAGLCETGGVDWLGQRLLGRPRTLTGAQLRIMGPVTGRSVFLNNTPVVAMLIPAVNDWAKRLHLSVSKLMIPLSYAAIFGGTCTLKPATDQVFKFDAPRHQRCLIEAVVSDIRGNQSLYVNLTDKGELM